MEKSKKANVIIKDKFYTEGTIEYFCECGYELECDYSGKHCPKCGKILVWGEV